MLFHAAGAEGSRPTFFEMAAADFLPASLKAAALYALGVRTTLPRHLKPLVWEEKERRGKRGRQGRKEGGKWWGAGRDGSSTERGGGLDACRLRGGIEGIKSYIWRPTPILQSLRAQTGQPLASPSPTPFQALQPHHRRCCTYHERATMSLNAHSLFSLLFSLLLRPPLLSYWHNTAPRYTACWTTAMSSLLLCCCCSSDTCLKRMAPHSVSPCMAFAASPPFHTALHPATHHYGQEPQPGEQEEGRRGQAEVRGRQGGRKVLLPYLHAKLHPVPILTHSSLHHTTSLLLHGRCCCPTCAPSFPLYLPPARGRGRDAIRVDSKHPIPSTTYQVLLPYLRAKLHALFAAHQRQRLTRALWVGGEGGDDGWGGTGGEEEWGAERDGGNDAGPGHGYWDGDGYGDEYGGAMGGGERSESGSSSPGSMGSVGSLRGDKHDGLGTEGFRGETSGGGGVAAAAARVTDGREEGGAGEEEADGQGGQVVTGGAVVGTSHARGNVGRRSSAIGSSRSSARGSRRWRQVVRVLRWVQRRALRFAAAAYPWLQAPYEALCLVPSRFPHVPPLPPTTRRVSAVPATLHHGRHAALLARAAPPLPLPALSHSTGAVSTHRQWEKFEAPHSNEASHLPLPALQADASTAEASSSISTRCQRESERLPGSPAIRVVQAALLKALYFTMDYAQTSVIAAVFAFKMAEWWYQTGEQKLSAPTVYPPPPPPPPPKVAPAGIPVPVDRSLCPLCLCRRTNPTAPGTSGFIFCYPCIFAYVDKVGNPVTQTVPPASSSATPAYLPTWIRQVSLLLPLPSPPSPNFSPLSTIPPTTILSPLIFPPLPSLSTIPLTTILSPHLPSPLPSPPFPLPLIVALQFGHCPITHHPTTVDQLRRHFPDA
ncbi:unnamed protein product [Closterium sp. NIES-54]